MPENDTSVTEPETTETTEPAPEAIRAEPVPAETAPAPSPGPWDADLQAAFEDEGTRAAVDAFLREKVQPRVTQLEQATAANRNAERLWNDFSENPIATYVAITNEILGEELGQEVVKILESQSEDPQGEVEEAIGTSDLPPEVQELVDEHKRNRAREAYDQRLAQAQADHPDVNIKPELIAPFVAAADGDFDAAVASYKSWLEDSRKELVGHVDEPPAEIAPPTISGDTHAAPGAAPPQEEHYESLDDALDAFFAEQKTAPPAVGNA